MSKSFISQYTKKQCRCCNKFRTIFSLIFWNGNLQKIKENVSMSEQSFSFSSKDSEIPIIVQFQTVIALCQFYSDISLMLSFR